jgi:hypothetical protein
MSVFVKGMDMPRNCADCPCGDAQDGWCYVHNEVLERMENGYPSTETRPDWCPLVDVPTPHGSLIDHKKLEKDLGERWNVNDDQDFCNKEVWHALEEAPTVIGAEG